MSSAFFVLSCPWIVPQETLQVLFVNLLLPPPSMQCKHLSLLIPLWNYKLCNKLSKLTMCHCVFFFLLLYSAHKNWFLCSSGDCYCSSCIYSQYVQPFYHTSNVKSGSLVKSCGRMVIQMTKLWWGEKFHPRSVWLSPWDHTLFRFCSETVSSLCPYHVSVQSGNSF